MEVYYGKNYWNHEKHGIPLKKISVQADTEKTLPTEGALLTWGKGELFIPALYVGEEGVVFDLCTKVELSEIQDFSRAVREYMDSTGKSQAELSNEEYERFEKLSPFYADFAVELSLDGQKLKRGFMCGVTWIPADINDEPSSGEAEALMKEYGCSREYGWAFERRMYQWSDVPVLEPGKAVFSFRAEKQPVTVAYFTTAVTDNFDEPVIRTEFTHPLSGDKHVLSVHSFEAGKLDIETGPGAGMKKEKRRQWEEMEYPSHYHTLAYTVRPSAPEEELTLQDCAEGDRPRRKGEEEMEDGPTSIFIGGKTAVMPVYMKEEGEEASEVRTAVSSLHFEPVKQVKWMVVLHVKEHEDVEVRVKLSE